MALRDLADIIGPLVIPIRGKEYTLPAVSLADGLKIHAARLHGADLDGSELYRILLGDVHQQLLDDHVGGDVIDRVFLTAYTDLSSGRDSAEEVWENGVPKAMREAAKELLALMTPTAEETTTQPPDSGTGTTDQPTKAERSRGKKSSTTSA